MLLTLLRCDLSSLKRGRLVSLLELLLLKLIKFRVDMGGLLSTGLNEMLCRVNTFDPGDECWDCLVSSRPAEGKRNEELCGEIEG